MTLKRFLFLAMGLIISLTATCDDAELFAYLCDSSGTPTNIRCAPNGAVAMTINSKESYMLELSNPINGWWQLEAIYDPVEDDAGIPLHGSKTGKYYIHYSIVGFSTRNYGQDYYLREYPSENSKATFNFHDEILVHPIEMTNGWVKVKTSDMKHTGWIESEMICNNPLTTCP
ncbi:MAG: hypothetical protein J6S96_05340 [Muribaculaceae bacterium]|nr:hypothetical protein [Muribaculaceae bacterium]